jgi:pimeloyl-ACP methyl ester carboxylesterase
MNKLRWGIFFFIFCNVSLFCQVSTHLEKFIEIEGEKYHYTDYGEGEEVILCLHGFALSSLSFRTARAFVDSTKYRLLAIDLKGFGFSPKPKESDYSLEKQATIVTSFLKKMNVKRAHLVGHSYGGMVCLYLNFKQSKGKLPFLIVSTTLIDTPAYNKNLPLFMKVIMTKIGAFLILKAPPLAIKTRIAINGGFKEYRYGKDEYLEVYKALLSQKEYSNTLNQAASQVIPNDFKEITDSYLTFEVPFLILWGEHDTFINIKHGQGLDRDIKNSKLEIIESTSHNPHEEKPDIVFRRINDFIEIQ